MDEEQELLQEMAWAFRDRPSPTGEIEIREASSEVSSRVKIILHWYEKLQDHFIRLQQEAPDLASKLFNAGEDIDSAFEGWKGGGLWSKVEQSILDYVKTWREVSLSFLA